MSVSEPLRVGSFNRTGGGLGVGNLKRELLICLVLALTTLAVYWQVGEHQFISYDDGGYVTENERVKSGLNWEGVRWALRTSEADNWHPLTWLSHMLDCELFSLKSGGHHLMNVALHVANAILVFLVLRSMTSAVWPSAIVAALFALHPLQVDSVAWVAERKNVLSTLFWLLTLLAYARYAQGRSRVESRGSNASTSILALDTRHSTFNYVLVLLFFALGLMAKPMLVTLPFVLLLLDYWPLRRFELPGAAKRSEDGSTFSSQPSTLLRLVGEKLPLFALAAASCVITLRVQATAITSLERLPFALRAANALVSYARYIGKAIWPSHLAIFYPHPGHWAWWIVGGAGFLLIVVTVLVLLAIRRRAYLAVGWLWFVGTLVPVIGLVQVGDQAMADRYMYVPLIGLLIMAVFGLNDLATRFSYGKLVMCIIAGVALAGCLAATDLQVSYWRSNETVFRHAMKVTKGNYVAYNNLGTVLQGEGKLDQAMACYLDSLRFKPEQAEAHDNVGQVLMSQGRLDDAQLKFRHALQCNPKFANSYNNLANLLYRQGNTEAAIAACRQAIALRENFPDAHNNLGCLLAAQGKLDEAIAHLQQALRLRPDLLDALNNLGSTLTSQGRPAQAVSPLTKAIQLKPTDAELHFNLANTFFALKKTREAYAEYQTALRLNPHHSPARYKLGNLLLADGDAAAATEQYRAALEANPNHGEAHYQLALVLVARKEVEEGITHYREAVRLKPDWVEAVNNLAWLLATHPEAKYRNGPEAVRLAERAAELGNGKDADALDTLAAAYAEVGRFDDATANAQKAIDVATARKDGEQAEQLRRRLQLYQSQQAYREAN